MSVYPPADRTLLTHLLLGMELNGHTQINTQSLTNVCVCVIDRSYRGMMVPLQAGTTCNAASSTSPLSEAPPTHKTHHVHLLATTVNLRDLFLKH